MREFIHTCDGMQRNSGTLRVSPLIFLLIFGVLGAGCRSDTTATGPLDPDQLRLTPIYEPTAPAEPDRFVTLDKGFPTPAFLTDGLVGVRICRSGFGIDLEDALFHRNAFHTTGEEKIIALPHPLHTPPTVKGVLLRAQDGTDYLQVMEFERATIRTQWTQLIDRTSVRVHVETVVSLPGLITWAVTLTPANPDSPALPAEYVVEWPAWESHEQTGLTGPSTTKTFQGIDTDRGPRTRHTWRFPVQPAIPGKPEPMNEPVTFHGFQASQTLGNRTNESKAMMRIAFDDDPNLTTLSISRREQQARIVIDGPVDDQQAIDSFASTLLASAPSHQHRPAEGFESLAEFPPMPPLGLSDTTYNGHMFWDSDIWVLPAIALLDLSRARGLAEYRIAQEDAYRRNIELWRDAGRPVAFEEPHEPTEELMQLRTPLEPIKLPWESSVTGHETVLSESKYQDHITASAAHGVHLIHRLQPDPRYEAFMERAANFYLERLSLREDGRATIRGTMSPDEFHLGDDDLYTNALVDRLLKRVLGDGWGEDRMYFPRDKVSFLNYTSDRLRGYKQAAGVLAVFPVQHPLIVPDAMEMLGRFQDGVTPNGPAMSDAIHALIEARFGDPDRAYDRWRESWYPFTRYPHLLFSEKRNSEVTYFTTGAGGALQTVLYGFAGIHIDDERLSDALESWALPGGGYLSIRPRLPQQIRSITLQDVNFGLGVKTITITDQEVQVEEGDESIRINVTSPASASDFRNEWERYQRISG